MNSPINDLVNNAGGGVSIAPGVTPLTGTTVITGDAVDCNDLAGPIHGEFMTGAAANTPDSFTATCKLTECDTSGGSYTDMATQSALVITAVKTRGFVRGIRTKRYVKCVCTPAFVGGSSPTVEIAASVIGQKQSY